MKSIFLYEERGTLCHLRWKESHYLGVLSDIIVYRLKSFKLFGIFVFLQGSYTVNILHVLSKVDQIVYLHMILHNSKWALIVSCQIKVMQRQVETTIKVDLLCFSLFSITYIMLQWWVLILNMERFSINEAWNPASDCTKHLVLVCFSNFGSV